MKYIRITVLLNMILYLQPILAQRAPESSGSIEGIVKDSGDKPVAFASVVLETTSQGISQHILTDQDGKFVLRKIPPGAYTLKAGSMGYAGREIPVTIEAGRHAVVTIILEKDISHLQEVVVEGASVSRIKKESAENISIVEASPLQNRSVSTAVILDQVPGIRVRQQGGLGSEANISLQGISGRQIRFFIDGIPLELFGQGMSIQAIPLNIMERIEVHKGYIPVEFGGDALGGIINIATKGRQDTYLEASGSGGSFNTQTAHLGTRYFTPAKDAYIGFTGFYNHSDNNYPVDVELTGEQGNLETRTMRRFHNAYTNYSGKIEAGLLKRRWADELSLRTGFSGFSDEKQHGATMETPFGQVSLGEKAYNGSLIYKKYIDKYRLSVDFYTGYNRIYRDFTDTSANIYNWHGQVTGRRSFFGETSYSGNLLELTTDNYLGRLYLKHELNGTTTLKANISASFLDRKGSDPVSAVYYQKDIFASPTHLNKYIAAAALEKTFAGDRIASISSVKYFHYQASGFNLAVRASPVSNRSRRPGFGQAFRYRFSGNLLAKFSYEYTARIPDETELFGIGNLVLPNPDLEPERSHNLNLGLLYQGRGDEKFRAEAGLFFRLVDDIIYQRLISPVSTQYQNLLKARVTGIEGEARYTLLPGLSLGLNATYQDIRNRAASGDLDGRYINARMPNIPYLFGNGSVSYGKPDLFRKDDLLEVWWGTSYVNWFYLNWAIDGRKDTKIVIPTQYLQQAGFSYHLLRDKLVASFEVYNLLDQKAYDNYSVQKPGRSYAVKLRTFLSKQ